MDYSLIPYDKLVVLADLGDGKAMVELVRREKEIADAEKVLKDKSKGKGDPASDPTIPLPDFDIDD